MSFNTPMKFSFLLKQMVQEKIKKVVLLHNKFYVFEFNLSDLEGKKLPHNIWTKFGYFGYSGSFLNSFCNQQKSSKGNSNKGSRSKAHKPKGLLGFFISQ